MKNNIDELLKLSLAPSQTPDESLNRRVLYRIEAKERKIMNKKMSKRKAYAAVAGLCTLLLASVTAYAAYKYLTPAEVADETGDTALANAFLGDDAVWVNETQTCGDYCITLLGSVAGRNISDYLSSENGSIKDDRIYTVVAIGHADGAPMTPTSSDDYGKEPFYVSHYIKGLDPRQYSVMSMGGGYTAFVKDGVEYRILEMDNLEIFADRGIYVGVSSGSFYDAGAYNYDESTGEITRNDSYNGVNALFTLPVDPAKADPAAAAAYLEQFEEKMNGSGSADVPDEENIPETYSDADAFMEKLTPENLDEYAAPAEYTRMVCTPNADGMITYGWRLENGAGSENQEARVDWLFPDDRTGNVLIGGWSHSGSLDTLNIEVFTLNEDGTVTFVIYQPRL